jgi:hypothetical protein
MLLLSGVMRWVEHSIFDINVHPKNIILNTTYTMDELFGHPTNLCADPCVIMQC